MSATIETPRHQEEKRKLSDGWRWVRLGEVVDCFPGAWGEDSEFENSTAVQVVGTSQISNEGLLNTNDAPIRYLNQRETIALCFAGDLLVVKSSGSAANIRSGKTAICPNELSGKIACANFLMRLVPRPEVIEPYLLWHFLNGEDAKAFVRRVAGSSTYPNIKWSSFKNLEIPLPHLDEQRRIAEVLREKMATVDKARIAAQARLEAVKALPAAFLQQVFPRPGQPIPTGWRWVRLGEVCEIVRGSSPRPKGDPRYYGGKVPRLMVEDVTRDGMYVIPNVDFLTEEGATFSRPMKKGDVVIVVSGAPGMPAILNVDACIHDGFVGLRNLMTESIIQEYLFYLLVYLRESTDKQATGAIFRNLTTYQVGRIAFLLPPIIEQKRILAILREQMAAVEKTRAAAEEELKTINALPAALLRRAFNGEI